MSRAGSPLGYSSLEHRTAEFGWELSKVPFQCASDSPSKKSMPTHTRVVEFGKRRTDVSITCSAPYSRAFGCQPRHTRVEEPTPICHQVRSVSCSVGATQVGTGATSRHRADTHGHRARANESCQRLTTIPAVGPNTATDLIAAVQRKRARDRSDWMATVCFKLCALLHLVRGGGSGRLSERTQLGEAIPSRSGVLRRTPLCRLLEGA